MYLDRSMPLFRGNDFKQFDILVGLTQKKWSTEFSNDFVERTLNQPVLIKVLMGTCSGSNKFIDLLGLRQPQQEW